VLASWTLTREKVRKRFQDGEERKDMRKRKEQENEKAEREKRKNFSFSPFLFVSDRNFSFA
jgi:hypothetical protein